MLDDLRTKQNMLRAQQSHDNDKLDKDQTKEVAAAEEQKKRLEAAEQEKKRLAAEQEKKRLEAAEQESQTYTVSATVASDLMPTANLLFGSRALSFDDALINALNYGSETGSSDLLSLTDESSDNSSTGNKIIVVIQV